MSVQGREAAPARSLVSVRAACFVLAIASLLPLAALVSVDAEYPGDDALISLTFAKNLARGDGFVFNHPPPVLGTTSPVFTLAVAAGAALTGAEPTTIALWLSVLCWVMLVWSFLLFRAAFGLNPGQAVAIGTLLSASGWVEHLSMEAYPFALLLVVSTAALLGRRPCAAGASCGLLFLTRGEGALYAAILGAVLLVSEIRGRRAAGQSPFVRFLVGFAVPIVAWALYAWPTFGSVLPNTLAAKLAQVASGLWDPFQTRLLGQWLPQWGLGWRSGWPAGVLGYGLAAAGCAAALWRYRGMLLFPAWGATYAAGYWWLGVPGYPWYRLPVEFVLTVLAGLGLDAVIAVVARRPGRLRWRYLAASCCALWVIVLTAYPTALSMARFEVPNRGRAYRNLAAWFVANADPSARVAYMEVGYLGYYTDLGIFDLVGLVSPNQVEHVVDRDFSSRFWRQMPEYLVHLEGSSFTGAIVDNPIFPRAYAPVATLGGSDGRSLTVFSRRAGVAATAADLPRNP